MDWRSWARFAFRDRPQGNDPRNRRLAPVTTGRENAGSRKTNLARIESIQQWFAEHVTLGGKPYTLDLDQARAVYDSHQNTLVTARAGSGKTRVIVAKVAYLVAKCHIELDEIAIFMFNRTAAAEVNQRITEVMVDGVSLARFQNRPQQHERDASKVDTVTIASTFHKFALNIVKKHGDRPDILGETVQSKLIREALQYALKQSKIKLPPKDYQETLNIVSGFITRAGQKYPSLIRLPDLKRDISEYIEAHSGDQNYKHHIFLHKISYLAYEKYLNSLIPPQTDFNLLMSRATEILMSVPGARNYIGNYKYLMIDEYQDFSYLFFALTSAIRHLCLSAKIFAVGDDWQAINRFAGSDVDYFINFANYFPENCTNIPLATNYRSCRRIVEFANEYMLKHYDRKAVRAIPFNQKPGHIRRVILQKVKYNTGDYAEDALGDGRFMNVILRAFAIENSSVPIDPKTLKSLVPTAKLLKSLYKIFKKHPRSEIMLLHRHNFTSVSSVTLEILFSALRIIVTEEGIMNDAFFTEKVRCMTMHKSKGLESEIVILLEMDAEIIKSHHPHSTIFEIFGDTFAAESADQDRLIYVALTRAKERLYLVSSAKSSLLS